MDLRCVDGQHRRLASTPNFNYFFCIGVGITFFVVSCPSCRQGIFLHHHNPVQVSWTIIPIVVLVVAPAEEVAAQLAAETHAHLHHVVLEQGGHPINHRCGHPTDHPRNRTGTPGATRAARHPQSPRPLTSASSNGTRRGKARQRRGQSPCLRSRLASLVSTILTGKHDT